MGRLIHERRLRSLLQDLHWILSGGAVVVLIGYIVAAGIPVHIEWQSMVVVYWIYLNLGAMFGAVILHAVQDPYSLRRCVTRYARQPIRIIILLICFGWVYFWFGTRMAFIAALSAAGIAEFCEVRRYSVGDPLRRIFGPALYFFCGLIIVFAFNDAILGFARSDYSDALLNMDRFLLAGHSVSEISRSASAVLPTGAFLLFDSLYFGMFSVIGGALVLIALQDGSRRALQYAGALLFGYYLALIAFYFLPARDPYYGCINHFAHLAAPASAAVQRGLMEESQRLRGAFGLNVTGDYSITFPCMHVALPLIALWFCRKWTRIRLALLLYIGALIPSILLLEWHYAVDIIGGFFVAALAAANTTPEIWNLRAPRLRQL